MRTTRVVLGSLVLVGPVASAQTPQSSPPPPTYAETVQVTATRVAEDVDAVATSIQVVTGDELRDRGATDLKSALAVVAGVDVAPGGDAGPAGAVPEFWGLKEFDAVLLVVDGVPWGGAFNPALSTLDLADVDHIEVQRGPAPVMYGATSFVGVVQVVRRPPGEPGTRLAVTGGSHQSGGASLSVRVPRWAGFDSSLSADFRRQGFADGRADFDKGHLLWRNRRTSARASFHFDLDGTVLRQAPASPSPRTGRVLSDLVPIDSNHNPEGARLDEDRFFASAGYDRSLGLGIWSTTLAFTHASQDQFRGFLTDVSTATPNAAGFRAKIDQNDLYFDSHLAWTNAAKWKAVAGVDDLFGKADAEGDTFAYGIGLDGSRAPAIIPPGEERAINDTRQFAGLYGNLELYPAPRVRIDLGARLNRTQEERGEGEANDAGGGAEDKRHVSRVSGVAGAAFTAWQRAGDSVHLFANWKNTFKPAAIDFNLAEDPSAEGTGILEPETANSYEAGIKAELLDRVLRLEAAGFLMDFKNLVVTQSIGGLPALANAGGSRLKGIEVSAVWAVVPHLAARGSYSFHDARFRDYLTEFDGEPTQLAGNRIEMSPRHLAGLALSWAPAAGLSASAELSYVGERFLNQRNSAVAQSYATLAANLGYRHGRYQVRITGHNLTDRRDPVAESELGDAQYYRLFPRAVDASLGVRF